MTAYQIGEIISLAFMAVALGMDAFSVSLGLGMQQLRLKRIAFIGAVIGLFHIIMPFTGILLGNVISAQIGQIATLASGVLLVGIGSQMFFSAFNSETKKMINPVGAGLLFFALSVSVDSFSVGLSLGMSSTKTFIALMLFGAASTALAWIGMIVGRKVHRLLGVYSEMLGGSILFALGLNIMFG